MRVHQGFKNTKQLTLLIASLSTCLVLTLALIARNSYQHPTSLEAAQSSSSLSARSSSSYNQRSSEAKTIHKRSFAGLGCLGIYDKGKFARLDRVCEECYQLYREPDIHMACRQDCFRNGVFSRCVDALLLSNEQKKLDEMVDELYG